MLIDEEIVNSYSIMYIQGQIPTNSSATSPDIATAGTKVTTVIIIMVMMMTSSLDLEQSPVDNFPVDTVPHVCQIIGLSCDAIIGHVGNIPAVNG